jgi:hypothetical protein
VSQLLLGCGGADVRLVVVLLPLEHAGSGVRLLHDPTRLLANHGEQSSVRRLREHDNDSLGVVRVVNEHLPGCCHRAWFYTFDQARVGVSDLGVLDEEEARVA